MLCVLRGRRRNSPDPGGRLDTRKTKCTDCVFASLPFAFGVLNSAFCSLERDSKLSALEERADALQDGSAQFEKRAASLKNKFWLENLKSMIAMGVVGLILVGMIYWNFFHQPAQPQMYYPPPPPPPPQAPAAAPAGESGGGGEGGEAASDGGK